jgi:hypothetical protein
MGDKDQGKDGVSDLARALAARRRIETKVCPICGQTFTGIAKKRYCSGRCATRAHRMGLSTPYEGRSRDEGNEPRRESEDDV